MLWWWMLQVGRQVGRSGETLKAEDVDGDDDDMLIGVPLVLTIHWHT